MANGLTNKTSAKNFVIEAPRIFRRIDVLEKIGYYQKPLTLTSALTLDMPSVAFARLGLSYHARDSYVSASGALYESSILTRFVVYHLVSCRMGATSAPQHMQYNSLIRLLAQVFFVLSTEGLC